MKTHYAIRSIEHNDIVIYYAVDFISMTMTICDRWGKPKNYQFSERWIEYERWWKDIIDALSIATKEWFEELRQRKKENDDETIENFVQVHEALNSNKQ